MANLEATITVRVEGLEGIRAIAELCDLLMEALDMVPEELAAERDDIRRRLDSCGKKILKSIQTSA